MNQFMRVFHGMGSNLLLFHRSMKHFPSLLSQFGRLMDCAFHIGYSTMPIVVILSFFIGAVIALQTGFSLRDISGAEDYLGAVVGMSMCREMGPLMTAFLLAGRVGSSITAEIASMKVYQEIDALHTMNIPPERILVLPRLVAVALMMPILNIFSVVTGWFGGMVASRYVPFINLDTQIYWRSLKSMVRFGSIDDGLIKAEIFGIAIVLICCQQGLSTSGGPREIGYSVTKAVVVAMVMVLLFDFFVTRMLL